MNEGTKEWRNIEIECRRIYKVAKWSVEQRANMIMKSRTKVRLELWATRMAVLKTYNTKVMGFEQLTGELPGDSSSTAAEYAAHSCLLVVVVVLVPCPSTAWSGAAAVSQQGLGWNRW